MSPFTIIARPQNAKHRRRLAFYDELEQAVLDLTDGQAVSLSAAEIGPRLRHTIAAVLGARFKRTHHTLRLRCVGINAESSDQPMMFWTEKR